MAFQNPFHRGWDPWRELEQLQREVDRLFRSRTAGRTQSPEVPAVNLWRGEGGAVLTAELPGLDPNELDVTVEGNTVTIRGNRPQEQLDEGARYHRQERASGRFARALELPFRVDPQKTEAKYERGVLTVRLTQVEEEKPKKINISAS